MKFIFTIVLFLITTFIFAQDFNIKTLELNEKTSNNELQFLKEELKNAQVVMFGENTHFDGNVFEFRNKVTAYLLEEMGFTTIALESGIYDVHKAKKEIEHHEKIATAFQKSLMGAWAYSKESIKIVNLFNTYHPKIFGFDNQFTGDYGLNNFSNDLYDFLKRKEISFALNKNDFELLLESLNVSFFYDEKDIPFHKLEKYFESVLKKIKNLPKNEENFYWHQIIESFLKLAEDCYKSKEFWTPFNISTKDNIRDKQMAKNLLSYLKNHPKEKIVCWGANVHFIASMDGINHKKLQNVKPMGTYIKEALGDKMYSLAAVTAVEEIKFDKIYKTPIDSLSFESFLIKNTKEISFIKANQKALESNIKNRLFSNGKFIKAKLNSLFDGYLFFKNHKNSTPINELRSQKPRTKKTISIKGKVIDLKTKEPLKMVEVSISNSYHSTFTDDLGSFEIKLPANQNYDRLYISHLGYHPKEIQLGSHKIIKIEEATNVLDEIVVKSNKQALRTVKEAIRNLNKNYQQSPFSYKRKTIGVYKLKDSTYLKFDLRTNHYNRGYTSNLRDTYEPQEITWLVGEKLKKPTNAREIMSFVGFGWAIFNKRKLKKFSLQFENDTIIENQNSTVISFTTTRQQYIYTGQTYKCNYTGRLFINKRDNAIVGFEQNWDVIDFTHNDMYFDWYPPFKNNPKEDKITKEKELIIYKKHENGFYYIESMMLASKGKVVNKKTGKEFDVTRKMNYEFSDYDYKGTNKINFDVSTSSLKIKNTNK